MEEKTLVAKIVDVETGEIIDDIYAGDRIVRAKSPDD